ncbi:MAG: 5'-methylthioadenosine/S-adenosylhomocysteine nucleosidase [Bacteroidota bacterium]
MKTLLLCPISEEINAIRLLLQSISSRRGKYSDKLYQLGYYKGLKIALRKTGRGAEAIGAAVHAAVKDFDFDYIFLVGTAGGVTKVKQGDVVVATQNFQYDSGRELDQAFCTFPKTLQADEYLLSLAESVAHSSHWQDNELDTENIRVHFKPIASGAKVIQSTRGESYKILRERFNDAVAIEMEAYAFQAAMNIHPKVKGLNVRSISDMLSDKEDANRKGSKQIASRHAAFFVFALLQQLNTPKPTLQRLKIPIACMVVILLVILYWKNADTSIQETQITTATTTDTLFISEQVTRLSQHIPVAQSAISSNQPTTRKKPTLNKEELPPETPPAPILKSGISNDTDTMSAQEVRITNKMIQEDEKDESIERPKQAETESEVPHQRYIDRCYIGVLQNGIEVNNVSVFIDDQEVQIANNYLPLPIGGFWLKLVKDNYHYKEKIYIRSESTIAPTFIIDWNKFMEKTEEPSTIKQVGDI